jgi:hypothetical protein
MNKDIVGALFPGELSYILTSKCPFCKETVSSLGFRDEISAKEFEISGLCQTCQDNFFEGGDDE